jgi:hypothetical protein
VNAAPCICWGGGQLSKLSNAVSGEQVMMERITRSTVCFRHPFEIAGVKGENPAGTYIIETTEEPIDGLSFIAYRRVSTVIFLSSQRLRPASRQAITINPSDLEEAQARDAIKMPV